MYHTTEGDGRLFCDLDGAAVNSFSESQVKDVLRNILDRKARNGGFGIHLMRTLARDGVCSYHRSYAKGGYGFSCELVEASPRRYSISFYGPNADLLLRRLNHKGVYIHSLKISRKQQAWRRRMRACGKYKDHKRKKLPRALAGAGGNLKPHFRKSALRLSDAVFAVAHAAKLKPRDVRHKLEQSLDVRSVATLRLKKSGFVFRIDLSFEYRGILDMNQPVVLSSTKDNKSLIYRRLRRKLRRLLCCERKVRARRQQAYLARRRARRHAMVA